MPADGHRGTKSATEGFVARVGIPASKELDLTELYPYELVEKTSLDRIRPFRLVDDMPATIDLAGIEGARGEVAAALLNSREIDPNAKLAFDDQTEELIDYYKREIVAALKRAKIPDEDFLSDRLAEAQCEDDSYTLRIRLARLKKEGYAALETYGLTDTNKKVNSNDIRIAINLLQAAIEDQVLIEDDEESHTLERAAVLLARVLAENPDGITLPGPVANFVDALAQREARDATDYSALIAKLEAIEGEDNVPQLVAQTLHRTVVALQAAQKKRNASSVTQVPAATGTNGTTAPSIDIDALDGLELVRKLDSVAHFHIVEDMPELGEGEWDGLRSFLAETMFISREFNPAKPESFEQEREMHVDYYAQAIIDAHGVDRTDEAAVAKALAEAQPIAEAQARADYETIAARIQELTAGGQSAMRDYDIQADTIDIDRDQLATAIGTLRAVSQNPKLLPDELDARDLEAAALVLASAHRKSHLDGPPMGSSIADYVRSLEGKHAEDRVNHQDLIDGLLRQQPEVPRLAPAMEKARAALICIQEQRTHRSVPPKG